MPPQLIVEVLGDTSQLERSFRRASRTSEQFARGVERSGRSAATATVGFHGLGRSIAGATAAVGGTAGFVAAARSSIGAAVDLQEQMSKTNVVFGKSAGEVQAWSETTATAFGISQRQALATASSFGALFAPLGIVGTTAAEQSRRLTELGADLASFYNTDVADALDAVRSGIVGESEPLRRYGVLLSETRVQAQALADTHKQSAKDLTAAEKAAARIALIFKDTSQAQGDFARTSESLANQSRELRAQLDDLSANIGKFYVPGLTKLAKGANEALEAFNQWTEAEAGATDRVRAALIPKLAADYGRLRDAGFSASYAIDHLEKSLGDGAQAADLVGEAINYFAGGPMREQIVKLRQEVYKFGVDAETAAKAAAGLAQTTAQIQAASPTGFAALPSALQQNIAISRTAGTGTEAEVKALRDRLESVNRAIAFAEQQIKAGRGNVEQMGENLIRFLDERRALQGQLSSIADENAAAAAETKRKADAAAKKEAEAVAALFKDPVARPFLGRPTLAAAVQQNLAEMARREQARRQRQQFVALGLTATGEALAPTREALQQQLATVRSSLAGTILDTDANRNVLERIRKVLNLKFGQLTRETKLHVQQLLDALNPDRAGRVHTATVAANLEQLIAGTGLTGAGLRRLRANLAGAHLTTMPAGVSPRIPLLAGRTEVNVWVDGDQVASKVDVRQKKNRKRTATQTRGRVLQ